MKKILLVAISGFLLTSCEQKKNENSSTVDSTVTTTQVRIDSTGKNAHTAVSGPDTNVKITEAYARVVARDAYFWAWPMVNIYNRRLAFKQAPETGLMNGVLPFAPLNTLAMLSDYIKPEQRWVACPNQDVVYGAAIAALDETPVVIQVPNFGKRFWVYQIVDLRTDAFGQLGSMYNSKPGFYMLVGPQWKGDIPQGIEKVFRSKTGTAFIVPRVFQSDLPDDKQAVQQIIKSIDVYALNKFDGKMKQHDWSKLPTLSPPTKDNGTGETKWVFPDKFFDELPLILKDAPPLPGEEARYAQVLAVIVSAKKDPAIKKAIIDEAAKVEKDVIDPLLQFKNWGVPLQHNWTTANNCAAFGTDYFTRTAIAKSNILVNAGVETKYMYQDLDSIGKKLNGAGIYAVTFPKGQTPPVNGFWSLTIYDEHHFFVPNEIKRYSLGTKNTTLKNNADGSLTIYVQSAPPEEGKRNNWLPAPKGDFSLYLRSYWPKAEVVNGSWTPPAVVKVK